MTSVTCRVDLNMGERGVTNVSHLDPVPLEAIDANARGGSSMVLADTTDSHNEDFDD